jgi:hypothetical protein
LKGFVDLKIVAARIYGFKADLISCGFFGCEGIKFYENRYAMKNYIEIDETINL